MRGLRSGCGTYIIYLLVLCMSVAHASNLNQTAEAPGAAPSAATDSKAVTVPVVTCFVDVGLPLGLLLVSAIVLRRRRAKATASSASAPLAAADANAAAGSEAASPPFTVLNVQGATQTRPVGLWGGLVKHWDNLKALCGKKAQKTCTTDDVERELALRAAMPVDTLLASLSSSIIGLSSIAAAQRLAVHGANVLEGKKPPSLAAMIYRAVAEPFVGLMLVVAIVTACPPNSSYSTFVLIMVLLAVAIALRFWEELTSCRLAQATQAAAKVTVTALRDNTPVSLDIERLVPGDIVLLSAGTVVPGDLRVVEAHNLYISSSGLTGEALPVERHCTMSSVKETALYHDNICLRGSFVVSGSGRGVIMATGQRTYIASLTRALPTGHTASAFDFAVRRIVYLFIAFIVVMVPLVIVISGASTGDWNGALTFGLAVAVGLTPQMLPTILTANLSRSVHLMRARRTTVNRMDAVQNLGSMDVMCMDKTGTLTEDEVTLLKALDTDNRESTSILTLAYANSFFQDGLPNLLDKGVLREGSRRGIQEVVEREWACVDEIPFDFERRLLSVLLRPAQDADAYPSLVCKGALEELLAICDRIQDGTDITALDAARRADILAYGKRLMEDGLRVVGLAMKAFRAPAKKLMRSDESGLLFLGFLTFLDPPKASAIPCIRTLRQQGIALKVLTGDSLPAAKRICADMDIDNQHCATGADLLAAEQDQLAQIVESCTVFAKVSPQQKMLIMTTLQQQGHAVGFLGDGTNDALAIRKADVGVSVNSATDIAKMAADIVMLDKDLATICEGVVIGRRTSGNTIKYIKMASSSSFGNTFSFLAAAIWLPFVPLHAAQILALNILYNISQMAIPWDDMDPSYLEKPKGWSANLLGMFMLVLGPLGSICDMTTVLIMWYFYGYRDASPDSIVMFQTAWYIESVVSQILAVHLLRTEKVPFLQSRAAWPLIASTFGMMAVGLALCYIPVINTALSLTAVVPGYYAWLLGILALYCSIVQIIKVLYIRVFHSWL